MKKIILAAVALMASTASADTTLLNCVVPADQVAVSLQINLSDDVSVDFITIAMTEKSSASVFFSQMDKGTVAEQMKAGFLNVLALTENSGQVDGVITNTGFLGLSQESEGVFGGFLAAKGNIYPLTCRK